MKSYPRQIKISGNDLLYVSCLLAAVCGIAYHEYTVNSIRPSASPIKNSQTGQLFDYNFGSRICYITESQIGQMHLSFKVMALTICSFPFFVVARAIKIHFFTKKEKISFADIHGNDKENQ